VVTITRTIQKRKRFSGTVIAMSERVTLSTVARHVGVSRATASNAYNRPDQLSSDLRERILAAADELGYAGPDPRASSLRSGRAGAVGLLQTSLGVALTDPASLLMLAGVGRACDEAGVALVLIPEHRAGDGRDGRRDIVRSAVVDGFVAHCGALDDQRRAIVTDRHLPIVVLDGRVVGDEPSVGIDEEHGARAAAEHVLQLGNRRIAVVAFSPDPIAGSNLVTARRLGGYLDAISDAGIDPATVPIAEGGHYDRAEAARAVAALLERPDRPTAILAMSDEFAAAAVEAAVEQGLRVPDDLSVVGFDDSPTATNTTPPLTTVHQDHAAKGATAVRLLLERAPAGTQVTLPVHLVVRESTGPPPGHSSPRGPVA
jgi:DNA-binding LacI/PurR family transcriptional regulator